MGWTAGAALAAGLCVCACSNPNDTAGKCPKPVAYDEATLQQIQKALSALPADNILHQVMEDYETERDDLRFCK